LVPEDPKLDTRIFDRWQVQASEVLVLADIRHLDKQLLERLGSVR